jgi:hypothetical protein
MNKPSKGNLSPEEREVVQMIAEAAGAIMFDHYEDLPLNYRLTLEDVIKNAHRMLDDDVISSLT